MSTFEPEEMEEAMQEEKKTSFEYLEMLDTVPPNEEGSDLDHLSDQKAEAQRYRTLLTKVYPPPEGCSLKMKSNPHDFGTYMSLEAWGDPDNEDHWTWVNSLCDLGTWDELEAAAAKK